MNNRVKSHGYTAAKSHLMISEKRRVGWWAGEWEEVGAGRGNSYKKLGFARKGCDWKG